MLSSRSTSPSVPPPAHYPPRMAALDATVPRWPEVPAGRGHYESFYLRAVSPGEPRGAWIRYTVSQPPDGRATGQLWFTWFDRDRLGPRAVRIDTGEPGSGH